MKRLKGKLTYANIVATLALFIAVGGASAFAGTQLSKNSVGTKQIKKGAVTGIKIKKGTITGANINLAKLGTVPSASNAATANTATTAGTANALSAPEPINIVNTSNEPGFEGGSTNLTSPLVSGLPPASFYKDHDGIVHLEGAAHVGKEEAFSNLVPIFSLPAGFRPANGVIQIFETGGEGTGVVIAGANSSFEGHSLKAGTVYGGKEKEALLAGVTYRAQG